MAAARQVQIEVTGKVDQYESALKQAESKTREMARKISSASSSVTAFEGESQSYSNFLGINSYERTRAQRAASRSQQIEDAIAKSNAAYKSQRFNDKMYDYQPADIKGFDRARQSTSGWLESAVKVELAMQATRLAVDGAVVGAKIMTGELRGIKAISESLRGLPIVGGVIGSIGGAIGYARADDLKAEQKANQDRIARIKQQRTQDEENARESLLSGVKQTQRERELLGRDGLSRELTIIDQERRSRLEAIDKDEKELKKRVGAVSKESQSAFAEARANAESIAADKAKYARKKASDDEAAQIKELAGKNNELALKSAGDTYGYRREQIKNQYEREIGSTTNERAKGLLRGAMNMELQGVDREQKEEQDRKRREKALAYYDRWDSAREQAMGNIQSNVDAISSQRLEASDAGMLTRGTGTDRSLEIAQEQSKLLEDIAKILQEQTTRDQNRDIWAQANAVGFN